MSKRHGKLLALMTGIALAAGFLLPFPASHVAHAAQGMEMASDTACEHACEAPSPEASCLKHCLAARTSASQAVARAPEARCLCLPLPPPGPSLPRTESVEPVGPDDPQPKPTDILLCVEKRE